MTAIEGWCTQFVSEVGSIEPIRTLNDTHTLSEQKEHPYERAGNVAYIYSLFSNQKVHTMSPLEKALNEEIDRLLGDEQESIRLKLHEQVTSHPTYRAHLATCRLRFDLSPIERKWLADLVSRTLRGFQSHMSKRASTELVRNVVKCFYSDTKYHHIRLGCLATQLIDYSQTNSHKFNTLEPIKSLTPKTIKKWSRELAPEKALSRGRNSEQDHQAIIKFLREYQFS